ncbi:glycine/D-amino acid oxidase-like deaminating enzyme [Rhodoligotrophos appendicifer]|uniref:NAD(P)/FAD-dependent oxidoreductase n=1 Tax=Rhodoligotrophos appendicifer TaxID=987056 RepID=UPI0011846EE4|nr:FAD-binding oxidoreductase [Rhodoligotrophos appendicifer]
MSTGSLFTDDFKLSPYWWDATPRPEISPGDLPERVDVAVIGSGYTGLSAALQTARGGRSTLVFDAEDAGWGCSTRNGGQISTSVKPNLAELTKRHGPQTARAILSDGRKSLKWIGEFVAEENIECSFGVVGRFHAAHNTAAFRNLTESFATEPEEFETGGWVVPRSEQREELGTDAYHGGVVYPRHAVLDPGKFHHGLLERVLQAGAAIATHCPVTGIERMKQGFRLTTPRGILEARDVVVATNGYTGKITPWQRRRVIPIGSYVIATEELPPGMADRLFPKNRIVSDTRKVVYYYRLCSDRRRIIFGGRVSHGETDPIKSAAKLRDEIVRLFPELANIRVSHSWMGLVAYTFDTLAHAGKHDGLHYAMGYCGSGVAMAGYLGMRVGQQVLGLPEGRLGVEAAPFQTRPLYYGWPWFLAPSVSYYRWRDSRNR